MRTQVYKNKSNLIFLKHQRGRERIDSHITVIVLTLCVRFLLAQFYLLSLEDKTTPRELTDALKLYQDRADRKENDQNFDMLAEAYDEVMDRINRQNANFRRRAHQVLSWVCYAKRQLYVKELQAAIAVKENQVEVDELDLCPINLLLSACCGIVVISEASETIQLVHYTAQDYFLDRKGQWFPHGQSYLAKQCMNYLSLQKFQDDLPDPVYHVFQLWTKDPLDRIALFQYAALNWGHHVRNAEDTPKAIAPIGETDVSRATITLSEVDQAVLNFLSCKDKINLALSIHLYTIQDSTLVGEDFKANALHMAAFCGLDRVIPSLLTGIKINSQDSNRRTALGWASKAGWITTVHLLVSLNADVDALDFYGRTPLFEATVSNHFEIVNLLIERGADIHVVAFNGNTALHYAAESNRGKIAHLLLDKGAKFDISNMFGQVPINIAVRNGSRSVYKRLLKMGVNPRSCGVDGRTILMEAAMAKNEDLVKELLKQGVNLNSQDYQNRTALMEACRAGNQKIVEVLLQHDAKPDIQDCKGQTALMKASQQGDESITALLLKKGANQHIVDHDGSTTLMHACERGSGRIVRLLLQNGADPEVVGHSGLTALECAIIGFDELSIKLLLEHGGHMDVVSQLFEGESPKLSDHGAALFEAFEEGCSSEVLQLLMERGQSKSPGWHNGLPFLKVLEDGHEIIIPLMRDSGVDLINCSKETLEKLISEASRTGDEDIVQWLAEWSGHSCQL
jgi:ankyrin repeat protein